MKHKLKQISRLFIVVCMALTMLPAMVNAVDQSVDISVYSNNSTEIQGAIQGAINTAATNGGTVTVTGTVTLNDGLSLKINSGINVDWQADATAALSNGAINLQWDSIGSFTMSSGSITNTGTGDAICNDSASAVNVSGGTVSADTGRAILNNFTGVVTISDNAIITSNSTIGTILQNESASITAGADCIVIQGGTVKNTGSGCAIGISSIGTLTVSGGTVSSKTCVISNSSTGAVNVSGGTVSSGSGTAISNYSTGVVTISGSALITNTSPSGTIYQWNDNSTDTADRIVINGGTVENTFSTGIAIYNNSAGAVSVLGGTVSAPSYAIYNISTGAVNVSGGTVSSKSCAIHSSSSGVISVSGGTVSTTSGYAIWNHSTGTINVSGGIVSATTTGNTIRNYSTGSVNISGGTVFSVSGTAISNFTTGAVNVSGGTVTADSGSSKAINNQSTGTVRVTGGTIKGGISGAAPTSNGTTSVYLTTLTGLSYSKAVTVLDSPAGYGINGVVTDADGKLYFYLPIGVTDFSLVVNGSTFTGTGTVASDGTTTIAMTTSGTATPTYTATLNVNIDSEPSDLLYNASDVITLRLITDGDQTVTMTHPTMGTWTADVQNGSWDLYINGEKSSIKFTVDNGNDNVTLDYFTVTTVISLGGTATSGTIEANGKSDSHFICLKEYPLTFTATGNGTDSYTYAWSGTHNGNTINGTGNTYTIASVQGEVNITCSITGSTEPAINAVTPVITVQPQGKTVKVGESVTLRVEASVSDGGTLSFQWCGSNNSELSPPISGATAATFTPPTSAVGTMYYHVTITNTNNSVSGAKTATINSNQITVTVQNDGNGGGTGSDGNGGGSSSGGSTTPPTTPPATPPATPPPSVSGSTATTTVTSTTGADGKAAASVPATQVDNALKQAQDAAAKSGEAPRVEIKVEAPANATAVETAVPQAAMTAIARGNLQDMTISSPVANLTFDGAAMNTIAGAAAGDVKFSASKVDTVNLPVAVQTLLDNRPVYEFSVTSGSKTISKFNGNVTVAVPYQLRAEEDPNAVIISFINASGNLEIVTNGRYDAATGTVVFTTDHFSRYAIGYKKINFADVADSAWYADAVTYLAARGITGGTAASTFSPDATLTRGQFITMLMRAYNMAADEKTVNNFSDAGDTYYTGYLAAAKRIGITGGVGDNKFAPDQTITRQEMFTMLYNVLKALDKLPAGDSGKTLANFTDSASVADWAAEAMTALAESGTVTGNGGKLDPTVGSTRAQMAQVLYNLLGK